MIRRFKLGNSLANFFRFSSITKQKNNSGCNNSYRSSDFGDYFNEAQEIFKLALKSFKEGDFSTAQALAKKSLEKSGQIKVLDPSVTRLEMSIEKMLDEIKEMSNSCIR